MCKDDEHDYQFIEKETITRMDVDWSTYQETRYVLFCKKCGKIIKKDRIGE